MTINWLKQFGVAPPVACTGTTETVSAVEAAREANELQRWWHERGHVSVKAWAVPRARNVNGQVVYGVASNIVDGLPPPNSGLYRGAGR